jgi:hypothetical protein
VVYVKADGIRKAVEDAVKMMAQMSTTQNQLSSPYSSQQQTQAYVQQMATQMLQALDPIIKKVDSRWIKIDPSDLSDSEGSIGTMQKCLTDTMKKFNEDPAMRDEVTKAYRDNPFLIAKRGVTVEGYKGAVGFELDMGDTTQKNAEAFGKQVSESKLAKELKKCQGTTDTSNGSTNDTTANGDQPATTIRMWVTPLTHQLKRVEMVAKGDNLDTSPTAVSEVTVAADFELNAPQTVEIPKDATSLKDLQKEIEEVMQNIYGVTPQSTQSSSTLYTI